MSTAKLVKGCDLNRETIEYVKEAYGYRWTIENRLRADYWLKGEVPNTEPISDKEWINAHAFYIRKDGRIAAKPNCCVPVSRAE